MEEITGTGGGFHSEAARSLSGVVVVFVFFFEMKFGCKKKKVLFRHNTSSGDAGILVFSRTLITPLKISRTRD